jgi:hypothetical protein
LLTGFPSVFVRSPDCTTGTPAAVGLSRSPLEAVVQITGDAQRKESAAGEPRKSGAYINQERLFVDTLRAEGLGIWCDENVIVLCSKWVKTRMKVAKQRARNSGISGEEEPDCYRQKVTDRRTARVAIYGANLGIINRSPVL